MKFTQTETKTHTHTRKDDQFCSTDHLFIHYFGYRERERTALICIFFPHDYHCLLFVFRQDHFSSLVCFCNKLYIQKRFSIISSPALLSLSVTTRPLISLSPLVLLFTYPYFGCSIITFDSVFSRFISFTLHLIWLFVRADAKSANDTRSKAKKIMTGEGFFLALFIKKKYDRPYDIVSMHINNLATLYLFEASAYSRRLHKNRFFIFGRVFWLAELP